MNWSWTCISTVVWLTVYSRMHGMDAEELFYFSTDLFVQQF